MDRIREEPFHANCQHNQTRDITSLQLHEKIPLLGSYPVLITDFDCNLSGEAVLNGQEISQRMNSIKPCVFILDVDGVMTTGHFLYTAEGKVMKVFGPDDNDGLSLLKQHIEICFITGDKRGFPITKKRIVDDMKFPLDVVSTIRRVDWIRERYLLEKVIYMGDGIFDHYVMREVGYAIAPANADKHAKQFAHYVTERKGGDRAVAEACLHILEKFFQPYNPDVMPNEQLKLSGEWTV